MSLHPGDTAPDFELPQEPGQPLVRLEDLRRDGPVVVLFFPLAWSSVCTQEMCSLRDQYENYRKDLGATVVGISVDSPFTLQAWAAEQGFPFPLLSDFNRSVARSYGVLYEDYFGLQGVAKRAAFVIDRDGTVRYAEVLDDSGRLPDFDALRKTLKDL